MVLGHTSGLPNWAANPLSTEWPTSPLRLKYAPDSCWNYSGEGYVLLQKTLEHLTGKSFETLAREEVFKPLGMKHSSFVWQREACFQRCFGPRWQGPASSHLSFYGCLWRYSLFSTAADYSRFLQALMKGRGLKPATADSCSHAGDEAQRCDTRPPPPTPFIAWACGVGLATTSQGLAQWQWGDNGNFKGLYMTLPGKRESLVFLTNSSNGPEMADDLLRLFFGPGEYRALQWLAE